MSSRLHNRSMGIIVAEATTLITINLTIGNVLVVLTMYKSRRLRTTSDIYIFALAVADLMWSTCVMPMTTDALLTGKWNFNETVCEFQTSIDYFVLYSSPVTMGLAAFNRYMRIDKSLSQGLLFKEIKDVPCSLLAAFGDVHYYHKKYDLAKIRVFAWLRPLFSNIFHREKCFDSLLYYYPSVFCDSLFHHYVLLPTRVQSNETAQSQRFP